MTGFDIYDTWGKHDSGWLTVGGTSLSAPLIAAMFALAGGSGGAAYPASSIYQNASLFPTSVYDVTSGGNSFCGGDPPSSCGFFVGESTGGSTHNPNALGGGNVDCSFPRNNNDPPAPPPESYECNATTGYDGPSGVGTPNSLRLLTATSPKVSLTRPKIVRLHKPVRFTVHATPRVSGAHITTVHFAWGDGRTSSGAARSRTHTYTKKGTHVVVVTVTDSLGQRSVASKPLKVGKALRLELSGPRSVKHGRRAKFTAKGSDPNTGGRLTAIHWSWGDHHKASGARAAHSWHRSGKYTITITLSDNTGVTTRYTRKIKVT
jgi:hypothetical protein